MDPWDSPGDGEEEPHFFLPNIDELTSETFDDEPKVVAVAERPLEKLISSPPPGFARIDAAALERLERRKHVANEWLSFVQELKVVPQLPSILEAVEACGAQDTTLNDVNVAQFAFALGETDCTEVVKRAVIRRLNNLQTSSRATQEKEEYGPANDEAPSHQPILTEQLESPPPSQDSPDSASSKHTDSMELAGPTRLRTRESDGSGASSATASTGHASSRESKNPLSRDDSFVEREKVILDVAAETASLECASNTAVVVDIIKDNLETSSSANPAECMTAQTNPCVVDEPIMLAASSEMSRTIEVEKHAANRADVDEAGKSEPNFQAKEEESKGAMKVLYRVVNEEADLDMDTDVEEEDDRVQSPLTATNDHLAKEKPVSDSAFDSKQAKPVSPRSEVPKSPVVDRKRPKKKKKKANLAPTLERSSTVSPSPLEPRIAAEVLPDPTLVVEPVSAPSNVLLGGYVHAGWTLVSQAHRMALDSDRENKYILVFIACFPELVRWTIGLYAPSWASVCLFYAFLIQVLCTASTDASKGWKVAILRKVIPLAFLLDGVSHPSLLLGFDRYELLITANLISAIKCVDSLNPLIVLTVAFQVVFALFARDVVCRSSFECDCVMLYLQGLLGVCGIVIAKTY